MAIGLIIYLKASGPKVSDRAKLVHQPFKFFWKGGLRNEYNQGS